MPRLLEMPHGGGRPAAIPPWAQAQLKARLAEPRGFASDGEIVTWLASACGIWVEDWVVYDLVRHHCKASLKTSRPTHRQLKSEAIAAYRRVLDAFPGNPGAHYNLGLALWAEGLEQQAIVQVTSARRLYLAQEDMASVDRVDALLELWNVNTEAEGI